MLKKVLIGIGVFVVGFIILVLIFGENNDERNARLAREKKVTDSIEAQNLLITKTKDSIHAYRMKNDRKYKDSIENIAKIEKAAREAEAKAALEKDKIENPQKYISVVKSGWEKGGFGTVALVSFTLKNESLRDVADVKMKFTFNGESGTVLGDEVKVFPILLKAGQVKVIRKENIGFIPQNASTMSTEFVSYDRVVN